MSCFDWGQRKKPPLGLTRILQAQRNDGRERDLRQYVENNKMMMVRSQWETSTRGRTISGLHQLSQLDSNPTLTDEPPPRPLVADILKQEDEERRAAKLLEKENARKRHEELLQKAKELLVKSQLEKVALREKLEAKSPFFY
jgi:hypothetical protein